jgi:hypothetical protein
LAAVAVRRILRDEVGAAVQAGPGLAVDSVLASAVGLECRGAIRTDNAQVLNSVVGRDAVDVVEDQRHRSTAPGVGLAAKLANTHLDALVEETILQVTTVVRRTLDEDLR